MPRIHPVRYSLRPSTTSELPASLWHLWFAKNSGRFEIPLGVPPARDSWRSRGQWIPWTGQPSRQGSALLFSLPLEFWRSTGCRYAKMAIAMGRIRVIIYAYCAQITLDLCVVLYISLVSYVGPDFLPASEFRFARRCWIAGCFWMAAVYLVCGLLPTHNPVHTNLRLI